MHIVMKRIDGVDYECGRYDEHWQAYEKYQQVEKECKNGVVFMVDTEYDPFDYFVVGDFDRDGEISTNLICLCSDKPELAEKTLQEQIKNPPKNCIGNIRIEKELKQSCWWNQGRID